MTQLFDLETDPWEMSDLAGRPDQRQRLAAMRAELSAARDASGEMVTPFGPAFWD